MEKFEKVSFAATIILAGVIVAILFHVGMSFFGFSYPFNTFLFLPSDRFMDFFNVYHMDLHLDPYAKLNALADYFPFCYLLFFPLTFFSPEVAFLLCYFVFCTFFYWLISYFVSMVKPKDINREIFTFMILVFFLSFPIIFALDRGNIDLFIFIFLSLSILLFFHKKYFRSVLLLSIVTSMKIYPGVFIILFIKEKRWKECILFACLTIGLTLWALLSFKTSGISKNLNLFRLNFAETDRIFIVGDRAISYSSSLFQLVKMIIWYLGNFDFSQKDLELYKHIIENIRGYYLFSCLTLFLMVSSYVIFWEKVFWRQVMLLTVCMILFPYISADYKLIFLFIPYLFFVIAEHSSKYDKLYTLLFALLFIPKNYLMLPGPMVHELSYLDFYSINDLINIMIMIFFLFQIIMRSKKEKDYQFMIGK